MVTVWLHFGRVLIRYYSPLPYWDYWDSVTHIDNYRHWNFGVLWQQHNEHRIVFPEIVFAVDYLHFHGREIFTLCLSAFCYFGTWLTLSAALLRSTLLPLYVRVCAILLGGVVMGWEGGALHIVGPFLIQWSLMLATAALALLLLTRVSGSQLSWLYLTAVIACSVICSYSSANGLFFWPVILLAAWVLRFNRMQLAVLAASAVAAIALYFVGYLFLHDSNIGVLASHPFYAIGFVAAYLGMPFTVIGPRFGISVGVFELAFYVALMVLAARRGLLRTRTGIVLLGFYLFCFLTASTTAVGRMNPQDPSFGAATAHRYVIVPLAAHSALLLAGTWLLGTFRYYLWVPFLGLFALLFSQAEKSAALVNWLDFARGNLANCQLASLAFASGVDDPAFLRFVYSGIEQPQRCLPILREKHLSTFADRKLDSLGKPATSAFQMSNQRESGAVTNVYPLESGLIVIGWTDSPRLLWHPQELAFVDDQNRVVGFGKKLQAGMPRGYGSSDTPQSIAWVGFVNLTFGSKSFSSYVIEGRRRQLVQVGQTTAVPAIRPLPADEVGAPMLAMPWGVQGNWTKNGPLPGAPFKMPIPFSYFESYAGGDANTGVVTSAPFPKPSGNCLVIPSAHGPSIDGLSARLIDADTKQTIASLPLMDNETLWGFWAVDLPPSAQHLQIVGEDAGRGWGQWLSIGEPRLCKEPR